MYDISPMPRARRRVHDRSVPTSAVERLRRVAAAHRAAGHPLAAEQAYRRALDQVDGTTDLAATVRAEYAGLLVELGREADAARVESGWQA